MHRLTVLNGQEPEIGINELYKRGLIEVERRLVEQGISVGASILDDDEPGRFARQIQLEPHGRMVATVLETEECVFYELRFVDGGVQAQEILEAAAQELKASYDVMASVSEVDEFIGN